MSLSLPHPSTEQIRIESVLAVLGDPIRLAIVNAIVRNEYGPLNCGDFLDLGSKTNLSYHLAKLREAGITRTTVVGTNRLISIRQDDLETRFPGLLDSIIAASDRGATLPTTVVDHA